MKKRVIFEKNKQKDFLADIKKKSNIEWEKIAQETNTNIQTLTKSYFYEKCSLPYELFKKFCSILEEKEKKVLSRYNAKIEKEKIVIGRKVFGEQRNTFNPIRIKYKKNDLSLDISQIEFSRYDKAKKLNLPRKMTPELAEEMGMHFGDGYLSEKRYEYRLKGNPKDERPYYDSHIKKICQEPLVTDQWHEVWFN